MAQAQQRCEDHHPALSQSVGLDGRIDLLAGRRQDLRIHLGLGRCEIAVGDVLKLGGQFLQHVFFEAAQQERPDALAESGHRALVPLLGDGDFVTVLEIIGAAQVAGHEEVEEAPEIED